MDLPSWKDEKLGSGARGALWLIDVVGVGGVFTKSDLYRDFPGVTQIDRRVRALRSEGWVIDTSREDPSLRQGEQRLVKTGAEVWLPRQLRTTGGSRSLSPGERRKVMQGDNHLCRSCGISGGEVYADGNEEAQLDIARRKMTGADGTETTHLVTECKRCRTGAAVRTVDPEEVLGELRTLSGLERQVFAKWVKNDQRTQEPLERLWGKYRTLPADLRQAVAYEVTAPESK